MRLLALAMMGVATAAWAQVSAVGETTPIASGPTAANDTAIWLHPTNLGRSLVFGTDSVSGALISYALDGGVHQSLPLGLTLGVDVKYGVNVSGVRRDVVLALSTDGAFRLLTVDGDGGNLMTPVDNGAVATNVPASSGALYNSPASGNLAVFIADQTGKVRHYKVSSSANKLVSTLVRTVTMPGPVEGMVSDDLNQNLYLTVPTRGLYVLQAEEDGILTPVLIESIDAGHLGGMEGVTAYYTGDGGGYVIASASATSAYAVYNIVTNKYVTSFKLVPDGGAKGATGSKGIDVVPLNLGAPFSKGLFVAHDPNNAAGPNYKLAAWDEIAGSTTPELNVDVRLDPRTWKLIDGGKIVKDAGPPLPICPAPTDGGADGGDAGEVDAGPCIPGTGGGGGTNVGTGGGFSGVGGGGGGGEMPGCSCSTGGMLPLAGFALTVLFARLRRRNAQG